MQSNTDSLRRSFLHARRAFTVLGSLMIASIAFSCTSATAPVTEPTALQKAVSALGGQEALDGLRALSLEGNGTSLVIDEGVIARIEEHLPKIPIDHLIDLPDVGRGLYFITGKVVSRAASAGEIDKALKEISGPREQRRPLCWRGFTRSRRQSSTSSGRPASGSSTT